MTSAKAPAGWAQTGLARIARGDRARKADVMRDRKAPFVLLDDARSDACGDAHAFLFTEPLGIIQAARIDEVAPCLDRIRVALSRGRFLAGYLAYETGMAFEPKMSRLAVQSDTPLLWFGEFDTPRVCEPQTSRQRPHYEPPSFRPLTDAARYNKELERIATYISAGDIYQANFTFDAVVDVPPDALAELYWQLRPRQRAGWGALIETGSQSIASLSPENFFTLDQGRICVRPMKGTAARKSDAAADMAAAQLLAANPKDRAENLMIVDLLRNDLSRVSTPGSVQVKSLFDVETYPTVHQMTSTITACLAHDCDAVRLLTSMFPCGSVTGAPKIRAMEIIAETERRSRGIYTGSIGYLAPDGSSAFNVAIRTIDSSFGRPPHMGIGSAIVADSVAEEELAECLAKARFLTDARSGTVA